MKALKILTMAIFFCLIFNFSDLLADDCGEIVYFLGDTIVEFTGGPGTTTDPTDPAEDDLPDFIITSLELTDNDEDEHYTFNTTDTMYMHSYSKNVGDADWAAFEGETEADDIYVKFYLSDGYKEDSHSEWECVGTEQIQKGNLDVGETKHEWVSEGLGGLDPGVYNIVVCVDRKYDQDNGDGEVPEKHKSNNCSTEAVFVLKEPNLSVSSISSAKTLFEPSEQINLSVLTTNEGGDVHSDIKLKWYLSEGTSYGNPILLEEDNMQEENLESGAQKNEDISFTAPQQKGIYTVSVWTDSNESFSETDENDNWTHKRIVVGDLDWLPAVVDLILN